MPSHGPSPMPRLNATSSPNSGHRAGHRRVCVRLPEVLTEAEVVEAEAELKALRRHALEVVDPEPEVLGSMRRRSAIRLLLLISSVVAVSVCSKEGLAWLTNWGMQTRAE